MHQKPTAGQEYEDLAVQFLEKSGLSILQRNFRARRGELDVIAREGDILVFVEVKGGKAFVPLQTRVTRTKMQRITRAIRVFLHQHPEISYEQIRVDIITVEEPAKTIQHFRDVSGDFA